MMVAREDTWPARLEAALRRPVQNYGTAGFAPPQESFALEDFALPHRPRVVVVAFFAGNDLQEAHDFVEWRAGRLPVWTAGWRIRPDVQRHETLFVRTLLVSAVQRVSSGERREPPPVWRPPLERTFGRDSLRAQVASYFPDEPAAADVDAALRHRLDQNEALASLCAREGIAFLDLTPALEAVLRRGESPYFAHDTHWNPSGHRVAAETLAAELRRLGWDGDR